MKRKNIGLSIAMGFIAVGMGQYIIIALAESFVEDEDLDFETAVCILNQLAGEELEM